MKSLILLVEDNEATVDVMPEQQKFFGHRVVIARNGAEAVASAIAELPDLIVMDIQLPVRTATRLPLKYVKSQRHNRFQFWQRLLRLCPAAERNV